MQKNTSQENWKVSKLKSCKLSKLTIPMTSVEAKRTFSTLKRIKIFMRNTMGQSSLNSLSLISICSDLLKNCTSFKEEVMEKFINQKERIMNFCFKGEK